MWYIPNPYTHSDGLFPTLPPQFLPSDEEESTNDGSIPMNMQHAVGLYNLARENIILVKPVRWEIT